MAARQDELLALVRSIDAGRGCADALLQLISGERESVTGELKMREAVLEKRWLKGRETMTLMKSIGAAALGLATMRYLIGSAAANADPLPYPSKVVTLVTHSSPGGGSDVFLREMSKYLGKYIDATFIVENVQGGSGAKAMARVATGAGRRQRLLCDHADLHLHVADEQAAEYLQGHGSAGEHLRR